MFTGIVEGMGGVAAIDVRPQGARLVVAAGELADGVAIGDSVAVNGVCLTVTDRDGDRLAFDAVPETLARTNLGMLRVGDRVNLERPLRVGDRLGGHFVQGHVDGIAEVEWVRREGEGLRLRCRAPIALMRYVVAKGSVALDGVSLTVAHRDGDGFEVALIPHTCAVTTLGRKASGDRLNLEVDLLAKYVEQLLTAGSDGGSTGA